MSSSFEAPRTPDRFPRPTPEGAGGMAKRAAMLAESYRENMPNRRGLCVLADRDVAKILRDHYPQIDSIDANVAILGGHLQEKVREALKAQGRTNEEWVIIATKTAVYVYEVDTGYFLPNNAKVWMDTDHAARNLIDSSRNYSNLINSKTPPTDPASDPTP